MIFSGAKKLDAAGDRKKTLRNSIIRDLDNKQFDNMHELLREMIDTGDTNFCDEIYEFIIVRSLDFPIFLVYADFLYKSTVISSDVYSRCIEKAYAYDAKNTFLFLTAGKSGINYDDLYAKYTFKWDLISLLFGPDMKFKLNQGVAVSGINEEEFNVLVGSGRVEILDDKFFKQLFSVIQSSRDVYINIPKNSMMFDVRRIVGNRFNHPPERVRLLWNDQDLPDDLCYSKSLNTNVNKYNSGITVVMIPAEYIFKRTDDREFKLLNIRDMTGESGYVYRVTPLTKVIDIEGRVSRDTGNNIQLIKLIHSGRVMKDSEPCYTSEKLYFKIVKPEELFFSYKYHGAELSFRHGMNTTVAEFKRSLGQTELIDPAALILLGDDNRIILDRELLIDLRDEAKLIIK